MKKWMIATAIGALATAGTAVGMQAQPAPAAKAPLTKTDMLARADARFTALDTNKDGQLSAQERQAGMERARAARAERRGGERPERGPGAGRRAGGAERMLARIDTNGDGLISRAENRAAAEARFDRMDADKDGRIERGERRGKHMGMRGHGGRGGMMRMADTNGDGAISRAEFDAASAKRFAKLDTNKDGKLDAADRPQRRMTRPAPASTPGA
ncbi:EF-hand domain-containing protein [Sphingomonas turrisvirgatae]|nr:EF-hand domain-containing protein [Sphingomonas turrisvirgatae]